MLGLHTKVQGEKIMELASTILLAFGAGMATMVVMVWLLESYREDKSAKKSNTINVERAMRHWRGGLRHGGIRRVECPHPACNSDHPLGFIYPKRIHLIERHYWAREYIRRYIKNWHRRYQ